MELDHPANFLSHFPHTTALQIDGKPRSACRTLQGFHEPSLHPSARSARAA